jgi:hypothetical protein
MELIAASDHPGPFGQWLPAGKKDVICALGNEALSAKDPADETIVLVAVTSSEGDVFPINKDRSGSRYFVRPSSDGPVDNAHNREV